jgi:hypothetical protein
VFPLNEDVFMPGEASVPMNSKISDTFCLKERFIVDVDYGTGFSAIGETFILQLF